MSLFAQFKANRDNRPDAAAFLIAAGDRSVPISWREFARDIEAIAWLAHKFVPGATVGLLGENSYEWMTAHAAGLFAGITVLPLETNLSAAEIAERLVFTEAKVLVHSALYADKAHEVERLVPGLIVGGFGSRKAEELMATAGMALDMGDDGIFDLPPRDEGETAMIVFTSGTTSKPRGAEIALRSLGTTAAYWSAQLPMKPGDRSLMLLPLSHIYGICATYMMLAEGVALGVCPDFRRIYDAVARFRANFIFLVPALAEILAAKIDQHGRSAEEALGAPIDWICVGGAPMPRRTYEHIKTLGVRTICAYGLTETTALYSIDAVGDDFPGSAGRCCQGFGGMAARVSENGTLQLKGPSVFKGYYKEPARTAEVLDADGWFDTGDFGRIDENGRVWVTGRASRTIILSSGKKVAPEELENKILSIPGVNEVVVSGDGATRELMAEIYAVVSEATLQRQLNALNRQLPVHKRIRHLVARTEPFPRTASGKIRVEKVQPGVEAVVSPVAAESSASVPSPVRPDAAAMPRRSAGCCFKYAFWVFTGMAVVVLVLNMAQVLIARSGVALPKYVQLVLDLFEEVGELLLAILVLPAVFFIHRWVSSLRGRGGR